MLQLIRSAAPEPYPVLLLGASGTGKELAARELHLLSGVKGPFVEVNCGAIAESLLESELFGHRKGAFTDAKDNHAGAFARADGGVLFLDEIADMPARIQAAVLRAISESRIRPVGADADVDVRVRIIAATNADLDALVRMGRFREELLTRLDVIRITVPPLSERREDIADIARMIAAGNTIELAACVFPFLETLEFRGNVRGLRNLLVRTRVFRQNPVTAAKLKAEIAANPTSAMPAMPGTLHEAVAWARDTTIRRALAATGGNIAEAARLIGIRRQALHGYLKRHPD